MDKKLLDILVCPATKGKLVLRRGNEHGEELWSRSAGLAYPIQDGIPQMIEAEARTLSNDEIASMKDDKLI